MTMTQQNMILHLQLIMYVFANVTDRTIDDIASSAPRASMALSSGFDAGSPGLWTVERDGLFTGLLPLGALCDLPFLNLLNDSLRDFLIDFLLEIGVSPAAITSMNEEN